MADALLKYYEILPGSGFFDLTMDGALLAEDSGLKTAVVLSLFTDRLAENDDELPDGTTNRRGVWTDTFATVDGDLQGSRLWLLSRSKQQQAVVNKAMEYAEEALKWLIDDGIAKEVNVEAAAIASGVLALGIEIVKPGGETVGFKFENLWEALNGV